MKISVPEIKLTGELKNGSLKFYLKSLDSDKYNYFSGSCSWWFECGNLISYRVDPESVSLDDIKLIATRGKRFEDSLDVIIAENCGGSWRVKFSVSVNNKISYIETYISSFEISQLCYETDIPPSGSSMMVSVDNIINCALQKVEDQLWEEFKILDSMLSIGMEKNGLRAILGKHNVFMTLPEWLNVNYEKFSQIHGCVFAKYLSVIKNIIPSLVDCIVHKPNESTRQITLMDDGKIDIKDCNRKEWIRDHTISNSFDRESSLIPPSGKLIENLYGADNIPVDNNALFEYNEKTSPHTENEARNMNNALKRIIARKNLIVDLKEKAGLSYEDAEKIMADDCDFVQETLETNESWTDIKRIINGRINPTNYSELVESELILKFMERVHDFMTLECAEEMITKDRKFVEYIVKKNNEEEIFQLINSNSEMVEIYRSYHDTREVSKLSDDELKYRLSERTFIPFHVADEMIKKDRGFIESVVMDKAKNPIHLIETNSDMKDIYYSYHPENLDILNFPKILKANFSDIYAESIWPPELESK